MMRIPLSAILLLFFALLPVVSSATLEWDRTEARVELKPGKIEARATFKVTNRGEKTLRIAEIKTNCNCTGSIIDGKIIEPGKSTEIVATFRRGKRSGKNHNRLHVYLDNQKEAVATLHFIVDILGVITARPRVVYWNSNSHKTEHIIRVQMDKRYVQEITKIEYDRSKITLVEEADPEAKADRILRVIPKSFDTLLRETIEIKAKGKDGILGDTRVHVFVQP